MVARVYEATEVTVDFTFTEGDFAPALKVFAKGRVNSGGWSNFELGVWSYVLEPKDGILDLDFLGVPPAHGTIVTMGFVNVNVGLVLPVPGWVSGVRIHASRNEIEAILGKALPSAPSPMKPTGEGLPLPWPFPWYIPEAPAKEAHTGEHAD
jgi:hypothetical protein